MLMLIYFNKFIVNILLKSIKQLSGDMCLMSRSGLIKNEKNYSKWIFSNLQIELAVSDKVFV